MDNEEKKNKKSDITTVYIADIRNQLEELYSKGYTLKEIIKKGIEYIKLQETFPITISEINMILNELKNENKNLKEISYQLSLNNKVQRKLIKLLLKKYRKKKRKKKSLLRRILARLFG